MRAFEAKQDIMMNHIIEQLHRLGYYDTAGKSRRELVSQLAILRATEVNVENQENEWF
ncbi:hypothetical protein ACFFF5_17900 [Lederbergia wuyishanensis]|uniref:Uncharacterized protein n=1 Tax=Lederbergia wuyishanensis TaxID=1347903 RepID=A0ABU0D4J5_9BACI|nr:hypothetical protein [Lederbergia wuyishanensis]MCJ8008099.1 hypothetical protein [Lederbergia wuyishanensis]MDQ0343315.1 hypothetical protein [Lederbergia wuyishanensis]